VQCSIGLFFTDQAADERGPQVILTHRARYSAGVKGYAATDSFTLPVDVDLFAIFPHCHYLGKDLQGFATLPDGTRKWLLHIRQLGL